MSSLVEVLTEAAFGLLTSPVDAVMLNKLPAPLSESGYLQFCSYEHFDSIHIERNTFHTPGKKQTTLLALIEAEVSSSLDPLQWSLFRQLEKEKSMENLGATLDRQRDLLGTPPLGDGTTRTVNLLNHDIARWMYVRDEDPVHSGTYRIGMRKLYIDWQKRQPSGVPANNNAVHLCELQSYNREVAIDKLMQSPTLVAFHQLFTSGALDEVAKHTPPFELLRLLITRPFDAIKHPYIHGHSDNQTQGQHALVPLLAYAIGKRLKKINDKSRLCAGSGFSSKTRINPDLIKDQRIHLEVQESQDSGKIRFHEQRDEGRNVELVYHLNTPFAAIDEGWGTFAANRTVYIGKGDVRMFGGGRGGVRVKRDSSGEYVVKRKTFTMRHKAATRDGYGDWLNGDLTISVALLMLTMLCRSREDRIRASTADQTEPLFANDIFSDVIMHRHSTASPSGDGKRVIAKPLVASNKKQSAETTPPASSLEQASHRLAYDMAALAAEHSVDGAVQRLDGDSLVYEPFTAEYQDTHGATPMPNSAVAFECSKKA
jgi:hypothetical protein